MSFDKKILCLGNNTVDTDIKVSELSKANIRNLYTERY
jgi:hypothetical protein